LTLHPGVDLPPGRQKIAVKTYVYRDIFFKLKVKKTGGQHIALLRFILLQATGDECLVAVNGIKNILRLIARCGIERLAGEAVRPAPGLADEETAINPLQASLRWAWGRDFGEGYENQAVEACGIFKNGCIFNTVSGK